MSDVPNHMKGVEGRLPAKPVDKISIEQSVRLLLEALGQLEKPDVVSHTPRRVAELYAEFINPSSIDIEDDFKLFENPGMTDMVMVNNVHYVSMCEHHLAAAFGVAHVAYIPDKYVAGYSKMKKALNYLSRQPQLNERLVVDATTFLEKRIQPKGIAMVLRSVHSCMALKSNAPSQEVVTVSDFRGMMRQEPYRTAFWNTTMIQKPLFLA